MSFKGAPWPSLIDFFSDYYLVPVLVYETTFRYINFIYVLIFKLILLLHYSNTVSLKLLSNVNISITGLINTV